MLHTPPRQAHSIGAAADAISREARLPAPKHRQTNVGGRGPGRLPPHRCGGRSAIIPLTPLRGFAKMRGVLRAICGQREARRAPRPFPLPLPTPSGETAQAQTTASEDLAGAVQIAQNRYSSGWHLPVPPTFCFCISRPSVDKCHVVALDLLSSVAY